ncbi:MarR family winged helix-turn-helix transcriptional regulator [Parahaliea mediterranea]|uniref:MarR family transcriptional regulator n=1 Tax=Parahaliea mediterranea TaxID=651086 RepID=A0A939INI1_9GAMM|nr:MarR family transcriptional regulator [Parahaliea mediterranea]MBN7798585.1 MarR family transcriptional regulator [Parahaliea mediterranea]
MSTFHELFDLIGVLAHRRYRAAERNLAAIGFNHSEARILTILGGERELAQDRLSTMLTIDRSNAGRSLKRLESEGYVVRYRSKLDKRAYVVAISDKGLQAVAEIDKVKDGIVREFFGKLTRSEAKAAIALLQKTLAGDETAK